MVLKIESVHVRQKQRKKEVEQKEWKKEEQKRGYTGKEAREVEKKHSI